MVPGRAASTALGGDVGKLSKTKPGADREAHETILCDDDPGFVLYRIVPSRYGLPCASEGAPWFYVAN